MSEPGTGGARIDTLGLSELSRASFFLDFDGTIAVEDTGVRLLEELAPPDWHEFERRYLAGRIGSRECMRSEWALLPRDRPAIEAVVRGVALDEGFGHLVDYLRSHGAEITILSDGFGFRASEVGEEIGVRVLTNCIDWDNHAVAFSEIDPSCPCGECGTCKRAPILEAKSRGRLAVLIGDGTSDVKGAEVADVVFAKKELADRCDAMGIANRRFLKLAEVLRVLEEANVDALHERAGDGRAS